MQAAVLYSPPSPLAQNQRAALISLLVDDDPGIYRMVRGKLLAYDKRACQWLQPYTLSNDPLMRRRAREIIHHLAKQENDAQMQHFCLHNGEDLNLEEATGLLARTQFPDTNTEAYQALFDSWADDIRDRIQGIGSADRILEAINTYLFDHLGFSGNVQYTYEPDCSYLNRVIDNRSGNPISLCAIYLFVAHRLRLPITGIALANHFLCRYQSSTREIYVDTFRRGRFWTKGDCVKHLLRVNQTLQSGCLAPVTPKKMLLRMCANLHRTYAHLELTDEATRILRYIQALSR